MIRTYFFYICLLFVLVSCGTAKSLKDRPDLSSYNAEIPQRVKTSDSTYHLGNNFLLKNKHGLWEMYLEGDPLERGLTMGSLTQELLQRQEEVFLSKVNDLVPSKAKQSLLRGFLKWYNRKMYRHITEEFKTEIYGVSRYSSTDFNSIAPPYLRALYLHSAHDIGHALQDLALVGCSSFAVWGEKSEDGSLLIGRNFDFYAGDDFAKEKIVAFVNPSEGYKYMSVTWGGMIGVVSGMNDQGLTVTINAGKSKIPLIAKTPISLVTREILQYASTIEEAIVIAKRREVFVSEGIFVGSAKDKKAVVIEVSPNNFGVYEVANSSEQLICSNHFQSVAYSEDKRNLKQITESHSQYRFDRMEELVKKEEKLNPSEAIAILRNKEGLDDKAIGFGNEKALNQLLAHHGIVFKPEELKVWISTNPYQLGEFVAYDLNEVFSNRENVSEVTLAVKALMVPEDPFVKTKTFKDYEDYRVLERTLEAALDNKTEVSTEFLSEVRTKNPDYWKSHYLAGKYYYKHKMYSEALKAFEKANTKEITTVPDQENLMKYIKKVKRKLKNKHFQ